VFTVNDRWEITSFNRAASAITGIAKEDAVGRRCADVFRSSVCEHDCALRRTLESGKPVIGKTCFIVRGDGEKIPISISTAVLKDSAGRILGGVETFRDMSEIEALRRELEGRFHLGDLVSRSPAMQQIFQQIQLIAGSNSNILLSGETGTGKEVLAKAIHELSGRSGQPFHAINCGALPDNLLESELFGYMKGSFTGAVKDKPGRFSLAGSGTLLLDEIGEISQAMQVRLLRVLQERQFDPLGGVKSVPLKARIIAATNRNLQEMVADGSFREDLYYRINVIRIEIPPLRHRKEDIPLLVDSFIQRFNRIEGRHIEGISQETLCVLMNHQWPGNIRELENVIERAFVICSSPFISPEHLPSEIIPEKVPPVEKSMTKVRLSAEAELILQCLRKNHFNREATARELGIHKTTLYRKLKACDIPLPDQDGRKHS